LTRIKTARFLLPIALALASGACQPVGSQPALPAQTGSLDIARFTSNQRLQRPNVDEWVFMGASLGLGYVEEAFDRNRPGTFQIVHMEPEAYRYFRERGEYADGTMFSLSFFSVQEKSEPALNGFAQQDLVSFEIHLIDRQRFAEQRAFYLFNGNADSAALIPAPNDCLECHNDHGQYDGTFTQFYPPLRGRVAALPGHLAPSP
jgi:hypothetical protein